MDLTIRQTEPMRLAALERRGPSVDFREVWGKLHPTVRSQGLFRPGALFVSVFKTAELSVPVEMDWYAAAMTLQEGQTVEAPLEERRIEPGTFVTWTYKGPYDGLGQAWEGFLRRLKAAGHQPDMSRACFEIYRDEPSGTPPEELRTELYVPVAG